MPFNLRNSFARIAHLLLNKCFLWYSILNVLNGTGQFQVRQSNNTCTCGDSILFSIAM